MAEIADGVAAARCSRVRSNLEAPSLPGVMAFARILVVIFPLAEFAAQSELVNGEQDDQRQGNDTEQPELKRSVEAQEQAVDVETDYGSRESPQKQAKPFEERRHHHRFLSSPSYGDLTGSVERPCSRRELLALCQYGSGSSSRPGPVCLEHLVDQLHVLDQMARPKERLANPLACGLPDGLGGFRITEQRVDRFADGDQVGWVIHEAAGFAVDDLILDAPDATGDNRPRLPHRLRDSQAEALCEALLKDHVGAALDRIDHRRVLLDVFHWEASEVGPLSNGDG